MKWQKFLLLGCCLSLFWGCASRYVVPIEIIRDSTFTYTKRAVIVFINPPSAEHDCFVGQNFNIQTVSMNLIRPGDSIFFYPERQDQQTFLLKWWEENGWQTDEYFEPIERPARLSDTVWVTLDDNFLRNIVLQQGVVVNSTEYPVSIWDDRGNQYGLLEPGQNSKVTVVAPGPIVFFFKRQDLARIYQARFSINRDKKDRDWQGGRMDWVAPLVIR